MAGTGAKLDTQAIDREIAQVRAEIARAVKPLRRRIEKLQEKRKTIRKAQRTKYETERYKYLRREPHWLTDATDPTRFKMEHRCSNYAHYTYGPKKQWHRIWRCHVSGTVEYGGLHFCKTHIWWVLKENLCPEHLKEAEQKLATTRGTLQIGNYYGAAL